MPLASLLPLLLPAIAYAAPPHVVDGRFDDWTAPAAIATDPGGDGAGDFDVLRLDLDPRGTVLHARLEVASALNVQSGPEVGGTLLVLVTLADGSTLEIDLRGRSFMHRGEALRVLDWEALGYSSAPTYAARVFELAVDLAAVGGEPGDVVLVDLAGSDSLDQPLAAALLDAQPPAPPRDIARAPGTLVRVASLNTYRNGMLDGERSAALCRLLDAVDADVICLQEEYEAPTDAIAGVLTACLETETPLRAARHFDCLVLSELPLRPLPASDGDPHVGAVVETAAGLLVVYSIHPKCCGYTGSPEDERRVAQMRELLGDLERARAAEVNRLGSAPTLVIGDWNLVGSRRPLTQMERAGFNRIDLRGVRPDRVATWYSPGSSFAPGVLDLAALDADGLTASGFVLDTRRLPAEMLDELGLEADDSAASDHLLLVVDLVPAARE